MLSPERAGMIDRTADCPQPTQTEVCRARSRSIGPEPAPEALPLLLTHALRGIAILQPRRLLEMAAA